MTARRPKSQEALISRRSRKELRRVLPREREKTQDTRGSCRAHVGDVGGHAGGVEGKELTQKRGGSQEDTRESRSQTEPGELREPRGDMGKADWNWEAGHERKHGRHMEACTAKGKVSHPGLGRLERQQVETDVWGQGKARVRERDRRLGDEG